MLLREVGREKSLTTRREGAREKGRAETSASFEDWKKTESLVGRKLGRNEGTDQRPPVEGRRSLALVSSLAPFRLTGNVGAKEHQITFHFHSVSLSTVLLHLFHHTSAPHGSKIDREGEKESERHVERKPQII